MSAGLSAEREAEIRAEHERLHRPAGRLTIKRAYCETCDLLAALDAERERRCRAEQEADTLAEALRKLVFSVNLSRARRGAREALAGYRAGRDEAKP